MDKGASLRDRAGGPTDLSRSASQPEALIPCAAKRRLVYRAYRSPERGSRGENLSYVGMFHDHADVSVDCHRLFAGGWEDGEHIRGMFELAGISDGDEFELVVRRTGSRPFGDRRYILQRSGHYGPETDAQVVFRTQHGRIWNYRHDAIAIEAATADETVKQGSAEGESAGPKDIAQPVSKDHP